MCWLYLRLWLWLGNGDFQRRCSDGAFCGLFVVEDHADAAIEWIRGCMGEIKLEWRFSLPVLVLGLGLGGGPGLFLP